MEVIISETNLDSRTYRKIFEFVEKEGVEPFVQLIWDIKDINMKKDLVDDAIFYAKHSTISLSRKNKTVVEFLRQFKSGFLYGSITDSSFKDFILYLEKNIDKLPIYTENAKRLEDLKICQVNLFLDSNFYEFSDYRTQIFMNSNEKVTDLRKHYTDGKIEYSILSKDGYGNICEEYAARIVRAAKDANKPSWVIETENHADGRQFRYMDINDFDFNPEKLPTSEELSSYEIPQKLALYRNSIKTI